MSFWGKVRQILVQNLSLDDEKAWDPSLWNLYGSQSLSGETVTEQTALTYSAVFNAVTLIAGTISTLPLHLLKKTAKTTGFAAENPLFRVLHDRFNPWMTAQVGRETMAAHLLLWGNCYAEIVTDRLGRVTALWPIPPNRCAPKIDNGAYFYEVQVDGQTIVLPRERVLHVVGLGFDGLRGYSVIAMARKSIGLGMAMESFGSLFFGNGTHPGVIVSHPGQLSDAAHERLKSSLMEAHSGLGQSHKLMLLEEGMKLERIAIPPEDAQFLQSRQFQIPEIARWFNLPPHKLKDLTRSSFSNIESEQISFVTDSILPWLIRFEQHYNMQLLSDDEQYRQHLYTRHNVDGLLRGNSVDRANYYKIMFGTGAMTINEIRAKEDWDPNPNPYADELFVPANNMVPLSKIDDYLSRGRVEPPENTIPEPPQDSTDAPGMVRERVRLIGGLQGG